MHADLLDMWKPREEREDGQPLGEADAPVGANQKRVCQSHDQAYLLAIGKWDITI